MITAKQIGNLTALRSNSHFISSLYLHLASDFRVKRAKVKTLTTEKREGLNNGSISQEERDWIEKDFETIRKYVENLIEPRPKSVAIFSCQAEGIWEVYPLPEPVRDLLVLDYSAYIGPLSAILDRHSRVYTLLVDQTKARAFEIFMGEIEEQTAIYSDVPKRVREGGWYGLTEKKIDRHVQQHIDDHLRKVADRTFAVFKGKGFDWLLLGGQAEITSEMGGTLHSSLRSKLRKTFPIDLNAPPHEVLKKSLELIQEVKKEEDLTSVRRLQEALTPGGVGISGVQETLSSLFDRSVHTLMVEEGFTAEGSLCPKCGFMGLKGVKCPITGDPMTIVPDIVDEAVASAIDQNSEVYHISPGCGLEKLGRMGALLRYKTPIVNREGKAREAGKGQSSAVFREERAAAEKVQ